MKLLAPAVLLNCAIFVVSALGNPASFQSGQDTPPAPPQSSTEPQQQALVAQPEAVPPEPTITVPAGTRLQLELVDPILSRTVHAGDPVRAATIAPVNVGKDLAIPEGTFVEGRIVKVGKRDATRFEGLILEFNRLAFTNGYALELNGSVINAKATAPAADPSGSTGAPTPVANSLQLQQGPTPPPLPQVGPSKGPIIAASVGGTVALLVTGIILGHRHAHAYEQTRYFEAGFQFEIVLQAPLILDRARIADAVRDSSGN
jgi:hypothetical protein